MLITDVNEDEITVGARVEFVGQDTTDFPDGTVGRVDEITSDGYAYVEFVGYGLTGETYAILPTHLALLSDDEWNAAVGIGG